MKKTITILMLAFSMGLYAQTKLDSLYVVWQDLSQPDTAYTLAEKLFEFASQREYLSVA